MNLRPHGPEPCAIPSFATPRQQYYYSTFWMLVNAKYLKHKYKSIICKTTHYVPQKVLYEQVAAGGSFLYSSYSSLSEYVFDIAFNKLFIAL